MYLQTIDVFGKFIYSVNNFINNDIVYIIIFLWQINDIMDLNSGLMVNTE